MAGRDLSGGKRRIIQDGRDHVHPEQHESLGSWWSTEDEHLHSSSEQEESRHEKPDLASPDENVPQAAFVSDLLDLDLASFLAYIDCTEDGTTQNACEYKYAQLISKVPEGCIIGRALQLGDGNGRQRLTKGLELLQANGKTGNYHHVDLILAFHGHQVSDLHQE